MLYVIFFLLVELFYSVINNKTMLIGNIKELKEDIDNLLDDKKNYINNKKKIEEEINAILNEINKYEELKKAFNKIF